MGNRLMVALGFGLALTAAACGDDDNPKPRGDSGITGDGGPGADGGNPGIDGGGMDATIPGDGTTPNPDGNMTPNDTGTNPGTDGMVQPQPGSVTKRITAAGGSVTSQDGNLTITFAIGVLQRPINVTIRQVTTNLPMGTLGGIVYEVTPTWENFTFPSEQRKATATLKYADSVLGGRSAGDLGLGRFEGGGWVELPLTAPVKNNQGSFIRGDLTKLGTIGLFTGVCEPCAQAACVAETCRVGEPAVVQGKCATYKGCSVCVPTCDEDGDGVCSGNQSSGIRGGDCQPQNPDVFPGRPELCNGIDDNCDFAVDEGCQTCKVDADCPTNSLCDQGTCRACSQECTGACNAGSAEMPITGQCKTRGNGGTCSQCVPTCDADGDRYCPAGSPGNLGQQQGVDCNDSDITVSPAAIEVCGDGADNDCDGKADNGCAECDTDATCPAGTFCVGNACVACTTSCQQASCNGTCTAYGNGCQRCAPACDGDGDGYCRQQSGDIPGGDCNDNDRYAYPNAIESCNSKDDDCDGFVDENCKACAADTECETSQACINGTCVVCEGSFDPNQRFGASETNPDAGVGAVRLDYGRGCSRGVPACDADKDGFCDPTKPGGVRDDQILGYDCDDMDPNVNRTKIEVCNNNKDDDCDGRVDENCAFCAESAMCGAGNFCTSGR